MKIIVRTFAGFEEILAEEIFQITNLKPEIGKRAVYLEGKPRNNILSKLVV